MSLYFREYMHRLIKIYLREFLILSMWLFIFIYLILVKSEFVQFISFLPLFYLIKARKRFKLLKTNQEYRPIGSLLLPMTARELVLSEFINTILKNYPFLMSIIGFLPLLFPEFFTSPHLLIFKISIASTIIAFIFSTKEIFEIHYVKISTIQKLLRISRSICKLVAGIGIIVFLVISSKTGHLNLLLITLVSLYTSYIFFNTGEHFFNEHIIYEKKNFKWFDVPGVLVAMAVVISYGYIIFHPSRGPASHAEVIRYDLNK